MIDITIDSMCYRCGRLFAFIDSISGWTERIWREIEILITNQFGEKKISLILKIIFVEFWLNFFILYKEKKERKKIRIFSPKSFLTFIRIIFSFFLSMILEQKMLRSSQKKIEGWINFNETIWNGNDDTDDDSYNWNIIRS